MFGLKEREISDFCNCLRKFPEIERAVVFGSRAMGNYKPGSDLDLALFGEELDFRQISGILNVMEESVFPHALDIVIYDRLENPKLKEHIVLLYSIGGVARGKDDLCEHGKRTV